jgi:hypothetical protein
VRSGGSCGRENEGREGKHLCEVVVNPRDELDDELNGQLVQNYSVTSDSTFSLKASLLVVRLTR